MHAKQEALLYEMVFMYNNTATKSHLGLRSHLEVKNKTKHLGQKMFNLGANSQASFCWF